MKDVDNCIDAVITWVDGDDLSHQEKRLKILGKTVKREKNELPTGRDNTRFTNNGELEYCIASIRKFAPWIHTIHLVTDNQVPDFLTPEVRKKERINVVDHTVIFKSHEWVLPTFNSRTIETALWRIPDLAPRFIYFNDDVIITKKVKPEDFFAGDKVKLRGRWRTMSNYGRVRMNLNNMVSVFVKKVFGITRSMHLLLQIRSAKLAGFDRHYFRSPHVPHPIRTDTLKDFFKKNPFLFEANIKFRFRNMDQFSSINLANHLEIKNGNAILRDADDNIMINSEMDFSATIHKKLKKMDRREARFVCLQGFESFNEDHRERITQTLDRLFQPKKV